MFANASVVDTTATFPQAGTYVLQLSADDDGAGAGTNSPVTDTVTIIVNLAIVNNQPPIANNQSVSTNEDAAKSITLTGTDPELVNLTFAVATQPAHGTITAGNGSVRTYTPSPNYFGSDSFTFNVNDGVDTSLTAAQVSIKVISVNDVPTANAGQDQAHTLSTGQTSMNVTLNGSGTDGGRYPDFWLQLEWQS